MLTLMKDAKNKIFLWHKNKKKNIQLKMTNSKDRKERTIQLLLFKSYFGLVFCGKKVCSPHSNCKEMDQMQGFFLCVAAIPPQLLCPGYDQSGRERKARKMKELKTRNEQRVKELEMFRLGNSIAFFKYFLLSHQRSPKLILYHLKQEIAE